MTNIDRMTLPLHTALTLVLDNAGALDMEIVQSALELSEVDYRDGAGASHWNTHPRIVQLCADMIRAAVGRRAPTDAEISVIYDAMEAEITG